MKFVLGLIGFMLLMGLCVAEEVYGNNGIVAGNITAEQAIALEHHIFGNETPIIGLESGVLVSATDDQTNAVWAIMEKQIDATKDPHAWINKTLAAIGSKYQGIKLGVLVRNDGTWGILVIQKQEIDGYGSDGIPCEFTVHSPVLLTYGTCDCEDTVFGWRVFGEGFIDNHPADIKMVSYDGVPQ